MAILKMSAALGVSISREQSMYVSTKDGRVE